MIERNRQNPIYVRIKDHAIGFGDDHFDWLERSEQCDLLIDARQRTLGKHKNMVSGKTVYDPDFPSSVRARLDRVLGPIRKESNRAAYNVWIISPAEFVVGKMPTERTRIVGSHRLNGWTRVLINVRR